MLYDRKFGIEIECTVPRHVTRGSLAAALTAAGVNAYDAGYSHVRSGSWKIVSDGSLTGNGLEVVSPPLQGEQAIEQIQKVCSVLTQQGADVNRSCGFHVHVDANGLTAGALRRLAAIYIEYENIIDSLMPSSRRGAGNRWCGTMQRTNMASLANARNATDIAHAINYGDRYVKLNYTAFLRHGTVEFRQHSGTVDAVKIIKWLQACLRLVACAVKEADQPINATQTVSGGTARPRNRRLATIYDLMQRPGGCTRQDVANVLGRRTLPPMNRILRNAGFQFRVEHRYGNRRTERYVLVASVNVAPATETTQSVITFDAFCARVEMPADEKEFWINRRIAVRTATA